MGEIADDIIDNMILGPDDYDAIESYDNFMEENYITVNENNFPYVYHCLNYACKVNNSDPGKEYRLDKNETPLVKLAEEAGWVLNQEHLTKLCSGEKDEMMEVLNLDTKYHANVVCLYALIEIFYEKYRCCEIDNFGL